MYRTLSSASLQLKTPGSVSSPECDCRQPLNSKCVSAVLASRRSLCCGLQVHLSCCDLSIRKTFRLGVPPSSTTMLPSVNEAYEVSRSFCAKSSQISESSFLLTTVSQPEHFGSAGTGALDASVSPHARVQSTFKSHDLSGTATSIRPREDLPRFRGVLRPYNRRADPKPISLFFNFPFPGRSSHRSFLSAVRRTTPHS